MISSKKVTKRYKIVGYGMDVMRQSAYLAIKPSIVYSYGFLFNFITIKQALD